jgi:hypothetical protein
MDTDWRNDCWFGIENCIRQDQIKKRRKKFPGKKAKNFIECKKKSVSLTGIL